MFLTPAEIAELTDRVRPGYQIDWLINHGWPFVVGASGKPKVLTEELKKRMLSGRRQKKKTAPRLDLVS